MPPHTVVSRRSALAAGAGVAGAAVLAACSSGSTGAEADRTAAASGPGSSAPAPSTNATSAATAGTSPAAAPAPLATLSQLTIGESVAATLPDGKPVLMTRTSPTSVVCFSAICTHEGCTVKPNGARLACPCHGSTFEAGTGKVLGGPAPTPLHTVAVTVVGGQVLPA